MEKIPKLLVSLRNYNAALRWLILHRNTKDKVRLSELAIYAPISSKFTKIILKKVQKEKEKTHFFNFL